MDSRAKDFEASILAATSGQEIVGIVESLGSMNLCRSDVVQIVNDLLSSENYTVQFWALHVALRFGDNSTKQLVATIMRRWWPRETLDPSNLDAGSLQLWIRALRAWVGLTGPDAKEIVLELAFDEDPFVQLVAVMVSKQLPNTERQWVLSQIREHHLGDSVGEGAQRFLDRYGD